MGRPLFYRKRPPSALSHDGSSLRAQLRPHTTRVIYLVRHGQFFESQSNEAARSLTALGRLQAAMTAKRLRARIEALPARLPTTIVHSTMLRAKETAEIIRNTAFAQAELKQDADLREGAPAMPEPNWWRPSPGERVRCGIRPMQQLSPVAT